MDVLAAFGIFCRMKIAPVTFTQLSITPQGYFRRFYYMYQRFLPQFLPVHHIYYYPRKDTALNWPRGAAGCFTVCLILSGQGEFCFAGKSWRMEAPFAATLWPGVPLRFIPDKTWEEFSISYAAGDLPKLQQWKIASRQRPCWQIGGQLELQYHLNHIGKLLARPDAFGQTDRLDISCLQLITETVLSRESPKMPAANTKIVREIEHQIAAMLPAKPDWPGLAAKHGLSHSIFRRLWNQVYSEPPARYALRLKIEEACRLLRETDLLIKEIAERLEFSDQYYFSKQFRRYVGLSAKAYRQSQMT